MADPLPSGGPAMTTARIITIGNPEVGYFDK